MFYSPLSEHHVSVARNKVKEVLLLRNYLTFFTAYLIELVTILRIIWFTVSYVSNESFNRAPLLCCYSL